MAHTEIKVALAALASVLTYYTDSGTITFLHASLPDFLLDPKRSQVYYIDRATWSTQLSILTLKCMISRTPSKLIAHRSDKPKRPGAFSTLFHVIPSDVH